MAGMDDEVKKTVRDVEEHNISQVHADLAREQLHRDSVDLQSYKNAVKTELKTKGLLNNLDQSSKAFLDIPTLDDGTTSSAAYASADIFKSVGKAVNPVAPPGFVGATPGQAFKHTEELDNPSMSITLDWRKLDETSSHQDGTQTYDYSGTIPRPDLNFSDLHYESSERTTGDPDNKLIERHITYNNPGGEDITFTTPDGKSIKLEDVKQVDTNFNEKTGKYDTVVTSKSSEKWQFQTSTDGSVTDFKKITSDLQTDAIGDRNTNLSAFAPVLETNQFNPVRPPGLAVLNPGQATDSSDYKSITSRTSVTEKMPDGTTTFHYKGKLDDGGLLPWEWGNTKFEASDHLDQSDNIMDSHINYKSPADIHFLGVKGESIELKGVRNIDVLRLDDGNYVTSVTDKDNRHTIFRTDAHGAVLEITPPHPSTAVDK